MLEMLFVVVFIVDLLLCSGKCSSTDPKYEFVQNFRLETWRFGTPTET